MIRPQSSQFAPSYDQDELTFIVYEKLCSLRLHFQQGSNYDFVRYNGKSSSFTRESLNKRKDRGDFARLSRKIRSRYFVEEEREFNKQDYERVVTEFLFVNFVKERLWVKAMLEAESFHEYARWNRGRDFYLSAFEKELCWLVRNTEDNDILRTFLIPADYDLPILLQSYLSEKISVETLIILNSIFNLFDYWDNKGLTSHFYYGNIRHNLRCLAKIYPIFWNHGKSDIKSILTRCSIKTI